MTADPAAIIYYHNRTKHQLNAYAKGPESLDWDDQPNPFRRFAGCEPVALPQPGVELASLFADLTRPEQIASQPLTLTNRGLLLELSFGLSAWKQYGPGRWTLRYNPSSGNPHPTEAYLLCTNAALLQPGVVHYVSHDRALNRLADLTPVIRRPHCTSACRPSIGGMPGNTANGHFAAASTTSDCEPDCFALPFEQTVSMPRGAVLSIMDKIDRK